MNYSRRISTIEEFKQIQLNILASLHQFCSENGIKYSLAYGSLIGAIRHKGFIPWDDDIDVFLLREDYNKFISSFPKTYNDYYALVSMEIDEKWHRAYGKMFDNRTVEVENTRNLYQGVGVGIDIFPVDEVPDDISKWFRYEKKRRFIRNAFTLKNLTISKERSIGKNLIILLGRLCLAPFSSSFFAKLMNIYGQKYNGKGYNHVYENSMGYYNTICPWNKSDFEEIMDASFEGLTIKIMRGYDNLLSNVYGDYMKLPPEEKRVSHHSFEAYWK